MKSTLPIQSLIQGRIILISPLMAGMVFVLSPNSCLRFPSICLSIRVKYCMSAGSPCGGMGFGSTAAGAYLGKEASLDCPVVRLLLLEITDLVLGAGGRRGLLQYQLSKEFIDIEESGC